MSMTMVFSQILVILLYVLVGFAAGKLKLITPENRRYLTGFCSNLILPFTILSAASLEMNSRDFSSLGLAVLLMCVTFGGTSAVTLLFHRARHSQPGLRAATTSLLTYPNCTFLGLPLCQALFGDIALLYNAAAVIAFNSFFFTLQYSLFTGKKFNPRNLLTPGVISTVVLILMLILRLHFPAPVQTVVSGVGSMITPLSLMIIGVMMSENQLLELVREKMAWLVSVLRNVLIPLAALVILVFLPIESSQKLCVLVFIACPCGTLTTIYAIQNDMEPELCARSVLLSTICFAGTLPLMIAIGQAVLG